MSATAARPAKQRLLTIGAVCRRLQVSGGRDVLDEMDVHRLSEILASKAPPPSEG